MREKSCEKYFSWQNRKITNKTRKSRFFLRTLKFLKFINLIKKMNLIKKTARAKRAPNFIREFEGFSQAIASHVKVGLKVQILAPSWWPSVEHVPTLDVANHTISIDGMISCELFYDFRCESHLSGVCTKVQVLGEWKSTFFETRKSRKSCQK